jgi:hypothetical protein
MGGVEMSDVTPDQYKDAVSDLSYRIPTLETYRRMSAYDFNFVWHINQGDMVNLLEEAIEEIDRLRAERG